MKHFIGYKNTSKFGEDNNDNVGLQNVLKLKAEFESTISFVIAKPLIAKMYSTFLQVSALHFVRI